MRYPLSSFFLRVGVARRSKAAHISRSSPHQVVGNNHEKRLDVDEVLYQHYVKKLLVGYLVGVDEPAGDVVGGGAANLPGGRVVDIHAPDLGNDLAVLLLC